MRARQFSDFRTKALSGKIDGTRTILSKKTRAKNCSFTDACTAVWARIMVLKQKPWVPCAHFCQRIHDESVSLSSAHRCFGVLYNFKVKLLSAVRAMNARAQFCWKYVFARALKFAACFGKLVKNSWKRSLLGRKNRNSLTKREVTFCKLKCCFVKIPTTRGEYCWKWVGSHANNEFGIRGSTIEKCVPTHLKHSMKVQH